MANKLPISSFGPGRLLRLCALLLLCLPLACGEDSDSGTPQSGTGGANPGAGGLEGTGGSATGGTASGGQAPAAGGDPGVGGSISGGSSSGGTGVGGSTSGGDTGSGGAATGGQTDDGIVIPVAPTPDERHLLLRDEGNTQLHYVDLGASENNWTVDIPVGRELQLVGNNEILIGTENGYEVRKFLDGSVSSTLDTYPGTVAARRLRNGNTLLVGADWQGETGIVLLEIDPSGSEVDRVVYPQRNYVRLVRPTAAGTYLLTSDTTIFEGDKDGAVLWQVTVQDSTEPHAWKALRLENGETVVATGYEASLQFFTEAQTFSRRIKAPSNTTPSFYCDFQILPNGNYFITNWQGHGMGNGNLGHQLVELSAAGDFLWSWQQDASFISSIQAAILLDGLNLGRLHVEDTTGQLVPVE